MFKFSTLFKHSEKYPEKIQEIHKRVDMSSDKALAEARQILFDLEKKDDTKAGRLEKLGFRNIESVKELQRIRKDKEKYKKIRDSIEHYSAKYPFNKFITGEEAESVCNKYNLYIADVAFFKGFVPERNLSEMETFVSNHGLKQYYRQGTSKAYSDWEVTSKHEFENQKEGYTYYEHGVIFRIMAPENQFYITNTMRKIGREIIDDPIVLYPVPEGYIVVTAWGDEASDPVIVNGLSN